MITAIILLHVDVHAIPETAQAIADLDNVSEVYSVTGDWELVALVRVRSHEQIAEVVTEHLTAVPGIERTLTLTAFRAYSKQDLEQAWDIGVD